jgi:hypothetical protein
MGMYSLARAKKMMNPGKLPVSSMRGIQGRVKRSEEAMNHSAPHLSASAPTIGPVRNVGAAAATARGLDVVIAQVGVRHGVD